jgi:16S rRNA (adenine1518-N6/adenine1519-N6)-dimethyltransferase
MTDNLPPLREVIAALDLRAKKSLGQNFLLDLNLTRKIARAAEVKGALVYEVGPGPGGLTRALLMEGAARVIAVERDARCLPALQDIASAYPGRLEVISADAMTLDEKALLPPGVHVAANLPYNVGTALLIKWLTSESWPPFWGSLTLMFQREVAQRITARPGSEHYGRLSVLAAWRTKAKIGHLLDRAAGTAGEARGASGTEKAGTRHRSGLRPAAQDAAPELESIGRRSFAGESRNRADQKARRIVGGGIRRAGSGVGKVRMRDS